MRNCLYSKPPLGGHTTARKAIKRRTRDGGESLGHAAGALWRCLNLKEKETASEPLHSNLGLAARLSKNMRREKTALEKTGGGFFQYETPEKSEPSGCSAAVPGPSIRKGGREEVRPWRKGHAKKSVPLTLGLGKGTRKLSALLESQRK